MCVCVCVCVVGLLCLSDNEDEHTCQPLFHLASDPSPVGPVLGSLRQEESPVQQQAKRSRLPGLGLISAAGFWWGVGRVGWFVSITGSAAMEKPSGIA